MLFNSFEQIILISIFLLHFPKLKFRIVFLKELPVISSRGDFIAVILPQSED